jgi:hypothetical protein
MKRSQSIAYILLAVLTGFFVVNGISGVDFGGHWDEAKLARSVSKSMQSGILLPGWYNYPSLCYDLAMLSFVPEILGVAARGPDLERNRNQDRIFGLENYEINHPIEKPIDRYQVYLEDAATRLPFILRTRVLFVFLTSLTLLWVFLLARKLSGNAWIGLHAAAILGLSWEVVYHSRWVAPDTMLMMAGTLTILCLFTALKSPNANRWLMFGAMAAGLSCGAKYPGGVLLIPVLMAAWHLNRDRGFWSALWKPFIVFAITIIVITPGLVLQPLGVVKDVLFEIKHYGTGHHQYTVDPGLTHFFKIGKYLSTVSFSYYPVIALTLFGLALAGIWALRKHTRFEVLLFLMVPVIYLLYFSSQKVMIVRNFLILLPFLAVLAAMGFGFLWKQMKGKTGRVALATGVILLLSVNGWWIIKTTGTIHRPWTETEFAAGLTDYLNNETATQSKWYFSPRVSQMAAERESEETPADADYAIVITTEIEHARRTLRADLVRWIGPYEVNLRYYPSWQGEPHLLILPANQMPELESQKSEVKNQN